MSNDEVVLKALDLLERETQNARRTIEDQVSTALAAAPAAAPPVAPAAPAAAAVPAEVAALGAQRAAGPQPPAGKAPLLTQADVEGISQAEYEARYAEVEAVLKGDA
jgi:hypothetical protein